MGAWMAAFLLVSFISSCSKEEGLVLQQEVVKLTITSFSTDPAAAFTVLLNNGQFADSLYNGQGHTRIIARQAGKQQIIVKDRSSGSVLIDSLIAIEGKEAVLTLMQLDPNHPPQLISQQEGEQIPEGYRKLAFYYTWDQLPDSIALEVYDCRYDLNTYELLEIDTVRFEKVKKGVLSGFQLIKGDGLDPSVVYLMNFFDAVTGTVLPNLVKPFDPTFALGTTLDYWPGPLGTEKHFINNLAGTYNPAYGIDIYSNRLISY